VRYPFRYAPELVERGGIAAAIPGLLRAASAVAHKAPVKAGLDTGFLLSRPVKVVEHTGIEPVSVTVQAWCRPIATYAPKFPKKARAICRSSTSRGHRQTDSRFHEHWKTAPDSNRA
jgi:hypothetical protein